MNLRLFSQELEKLSAKSTAFDTGLQFLVEAMKLIESAVNHLHLPAKRNLVRNRLEKARGFLTDARNLLAAEGMEANPVKMVVDRYLRICNTALSSKKS